jgi:hypothetical protein
MNADLTRSTFRPERHYSGVRMQQGRVQVDADWNEQVDIGAHLDETTRVDVIGRCGMPEDNAGFEITPAADGSDLLLSPGRAYVDGILCESDASLIALLDVDVSKAKLASFVADGRELEPGDWIQLSGTGVGPFTARTESLDAGTFTITFKPALSAANADALDKAKDTVVRRLASYLTQPDFPGVRPSALDDEAGMYLAYLDVWERHVTALEDGGIREVALGGPDTSTRTQTVWQVKLERLGDPGAEITCATVPGWRELFDESTALLRARAQPETTSADPCTIPPGAGFRRLENQLYRVEIHDGGNVGTATFKWSRENGSVVVAGNVTDTDELTVASTGRDEVLGIAPGNWVELTDGTHELAGEPGALVKVKSIAGNVLTVDTTSSGPLAAAEFPDAPKVRRWDDANGPRKVTVPGTNQGFLGLEDGVEVRFEPGRRYASGDYWLIPARTATGDVEWPENGGSPAAPLGRPPDGIRHHYCSLALLRLSGEKWEVAEDCRKLFPPLAGLHGLQQDPGVRVVRVRSGQQDPLRNDTDLLLRDFVKGLEVVCDEDIEAGTLAGKPTLLLTLDLPFPLSTADQALWGRDLVGTMPLTLNGIVQVRGTLIRWLPTEAVSRWLLSRVAKVVQAAKLERLLLHLTLKGNFVYGTKDTSLNVDGEAFGVLHDGTLDASLPSGAGRRGGNLDLWFWLRAKPLGRTDTLVLAPVLKARRLTTIARRTALATSIGFTVDRAKLMAALPETYTIDTRAVTDPTRARTAVSRLRLAADTIVRIAVEEEVAAAADVIFAELQENNVALQIVAVTVADAVESFDELVSSAAGIDGVLASEETIQRLAQAHPDQVDLERALRF